MAYRSLEEVLDYREAYNRKFYEAVMDNDCQKRTVTEEESRQQVYTMWGATLLASITYRGNRKPASSLTDGQGLLMRKYVGRDEALCGDFISQVTAQALEMRESNACMERIVVALAAGFCEVLPTIMIPYCRTYSVSRQAIIESLYVAVGIGQVIAVRASIVGAADGCQAEIGSASSMATGTMVTLKGGTNQQIVVASTIVLKCPLSLIYDPVADLVKVPYVKRNAMDVISALTAADMALTGVVSATPTNQVIDAIWEVGEKMRPSLRGAGGDGLAVTPVAIDFTDLFKSRK